MHLTSMMLPYAFHYWHIYRKVYGQVCQYLILASSNVQKDKTDPLIHATNMVVTHMLLVAHKACSTNMLVTHKACLRCSSSEPKLSTHTHISPLKPSKRVTLPSCAGVVGWFLLFPSLQNEFFHLFQKKKGEKKRSHPNTAATKFKIVVTAAKFRMVTSFFFSQFLISKIWRFVFKIAKFDFSFSPFWVLSIALSFFTAPMMGLRFWVLSFGWMLILSFLLFLFHMVVYKEKRV